jgi:sugar (pentulose or hexulose) kinase
MPSTSRRSGKGAGEVLVAVDVGTSGARAAAFDLEGRAVADARRSYPTALPRDGWAEQDANHWRRAALGALGQLVRDLGSRRPIAAIGLTGQCPSVVPIDRRGRPLRPGIIYRDNRATSEADEIRRQFGDRALHDRTGHLPAAFHVAAKILWIRANEPAVFASTDRFLEPSDYVALALVGEPVTDWTIAAASALFDLRARRWDEGILNGLDLDRRLLPTAHPSWSIVGELRPALVRRFGLSRTIPVVIGAGDSIACAFGAGVTGPGPVSEMAGSSTCLNTVVAEPLADLAVTHYPSAVSPDGYVTEVGINTTGEAVDWLTALTYGGRAGHPRDADFAAFDADAARVAPGSDGVLFLPTLGDGERDDPGLRGAVVGLSLRHDRRVLGRAVLEGVAFGIRARIEALTRAGSPASELRVSGGDASLRTWNRIKADVLGIPVTRVPGDATAAGVAMLAGLGVGLYRDAAETLASAGHLEPSIEPDPETHARYESIYERYQTLLASSVVRGLEGGAA